MAYKGLSGLPGTSGTLTARHDSSLVRVVKEQKKPRRKYAIVCPHAGKGFCWTEFRKSLRQLPIDQSHVVLYDNSRSGLHRRRLESLADSLPSFTLIQDMNTPQSIESTRDFVPIVKRCSEVYEEIYGNHLSRSEFVINLEDDIGVPAGGFEQLLWAMKDENVGTVIGDCNDRRTMVSEGRIQSIVCNFLEVKEIGGAAGVEIQTELVPTKPGGLEWVGSGHMGLWLSRREAVDEVGMKTTLGEPIGHDIQYGLRLNRAGWRFAVNWGVKLKHFYQDGKQKMNV